MQTVLKHEGHLRSAKKKVQIQHGLLLFKISHAMMREAKAVLALTLAMLGCMCMAIGAPFSRNICLSSMPAIWHAST